MGVAVYGRFLVWELRSEGIAVYKSCGLQELHCVEVAVSGSYSVWCVKVAVCEGNSVGLQNMGVAECGFCVVWWLQNLGVLGLQR